MPEGSADVESAVHPCFRCDVGGVEDTEVALGSGSDLTGRKGCRYHEDVALPSDFDS